MNYRIIQSTSHFEKNIGETANVSLSRTFTNIRNMRHANRKITKKNKVHHESNHDHCPPALFLIKYLKVDQIFSTKTMTKIFLNQIFF